MDYSLDDFKARFIEEASDNINDLEKALLELEKTPSDRNLVEKIFRSMHSLKGGGGMFGFDQLSEFTHDLESIYDLIRSGSLQVSSSLLSITLESVDLLRDLINTQGSIEGPLSVRFEEMKRKVQTLVRNETEGILSSVKLNQLPRVEEKNAAAGLTTYYVRFLPDSEVLMNGTNLLYLIDELYSLGSVLTRPHYQTTPLLEDLEPAKCYVWWELFVATSKKMQEICDVFIFVEDTSEIDIEKLADLDLLSNPVFADKVNELFHQGMAIDLSSLRLFIKNEITKPENLPEEAQILKENSSSSYKSNSVTSLRVSSEKVDGLMNLVSELVISQERLNLVSRKHEIPDLKLVANTLEKLTAQLRDSTFSISMIPIESLTMRFHRLVRDLGNELGKEITFTTEGEDTELDKSMIERLTDPLLHIIRNSVDHGIETAIEREKAGKSREGTIKLKAFYSGASVILEVSDDGAGMDPEIIRAKAVAKGIIRKEDLLSEQEIFNLVFLPGFSTRENVSKVSGRGVGMDVVMKNISAIRGDVKIYSQPGIGTTVTINLPLMLSIIDGLLVWIGNNKYVIPLSLVDRIFSLESDQINKVFNRIIVLDGVQYPFFDLHDCFSLQEERPDRMQAVLVTYNGQKVAFSVDQVVGKIQAVLKPLGKLYHDHKFLSAATIMGDGTIALVIDPNAIISEFNSANIF
ncbi:MAG: chemotaxis protein CheA [Bacteroidales bacterium]|nr:chemotaxis protein CheA [Bacteroidales bacterium]